MMLMTRPTSLVSWRDFANCKGADPEVFYPSDDDELADLAPGYGAEAKAICEACPVLEVCLEHALVLREKHGIWGGLTARERRRLIRRRRRAS